MKVRRLSEINIAKCYFQTDSALRIWCTTWCRYPISRVTSLARGGSYRCHVSRIVLRHEVNIQTNPAHEKKRSVKIVGPTNHASLRPEPTRARSSEATWFCLNKTTCQVSSLALMTRDSGNSLRCQFDSCITMRLAHFRRRADTPTFDLVSFRFEPS